VGVALKNLQAILNPDNLSNRFAWIETMMDGSKTINSVPETVATILFDRLLSRTPTTLLIPHVGAALMHAIIDERAEKKPDTSVWQPAPLPIEFPIGAVLENVIKNAKGKTVLLVGSKRMIEDVFVKHSEEAEDRAVTLICQGYAGGHGRMQAEFLAAKGDAMLVLTPWMYEGMELKPGVVDTLIVHTIPFDHPSHAVISRRALRYQNAFGQYSLPRLLNRLFRLTRTFVRHAAKNAKVIVLDERIRTKGYGKDVKTYLETLFGAAKPAKTQVKEQMPLL
jgi:Helicase C-terminal domain